jgi:hypothetical protein
MKKYSSISEVKADYESKKADKPELERPAHAEKYAEKARQQVQTSKNKHPASS